MNSKFTLILGLSLIFTTFSQIGAGKEKKKFKLVLDKLEKLNDAEHIVSTKFSLDKDGDTNKVVLNGILETFVDLNDKHRLTFDVLHSPEQDGEKKTMFRVTDKGVCEIMKTHYKKFVYESLKKHCNAPDPDKCPVAKDQFEVIKYPMEFFRPSLSGFYRMEATLRHNDEEVMRYRVEAHTQEL